MGLFDNMVRLAAPRRERAALQTPAVAGWNVTGMMHGFLNSQEVTPAKFQAAYRSTVAMLIQYRASNFARHLAGLRVQRAMEGEQEQYEDVEQEHPQSVLLRRPNVYMPPGHVYQWLSMNRDGVGHADMVVEYGRVSVLGVSANVPIALHPIFPEFGRVEPIIGPMGGVVEWVYYRTDGQIIRVPLESIIRVKRLHPVAPYYTAGLIEAAAYEIDQDMAANVYGRDAMRSQGTPDVMLESAETLPQAKLQTLSSDFASLYNAHMRGKGGGVPVSHGGLSIKPLNLSQRESQFIEQREFIKRAVFQMLETHEGLFAKDSTRANAEAGQYGFAVNTVEPNCTDIAEQLEFEFERIFKADRDALRFKLPDDIVPEDRETKEKINLMRIQRGVPINAIMRENGEDEVEGGDEPLVAGLLQPLSALGDVGF